jgi:predicted GNAT family acetyltransferase
MSKRNLFIKKALKLVANNPQFNNIRISNDGNRVTFYKNKVNKNILYSTYRNTGNNLLHTAGMYTNNSIRGRGQQQKFLGLAVLAAKRSGYKGMNGLSRHFIFLNNAGSAKKFNNPKTTPNMPPSSYVFKKLDFVRQPPNKPGNNNAGKNQKIKWRRLF